MRRSSGSPGHRPVGGTIAVAVALAATLVGAGLAFWPGSGWRADPNDPRLVALGAAVYRNHCLGCHGESLQGQPNWRVRKPDGRLPAPPHDETGHTWHHADDQLFRLTKFGMRPPLAPKGYVSDMPPFIGVLSDKDILAVLAFIKSRWPQDIRERQRRIDEASRR